MLNTRTKNYEVLEKEKVDQPISSRSELKIIENDDELNKHLDRMHRRWVARNLFGVEAGPEEEMRSHSNANACMANGKSLLMTVLERNQESNRFVCFHLFLYEADRRDVTQT